MKTKMTSQALEQMLELVPTIGQEGMYQTIDTYAAGTTALYTPPPKPFGPQPFQFGYDLPATGTQIHFHGHDSDHLTYGRIKDYNGNVLGEIKSSYDLAMADLNAQKIGLKSFLNFLIYFLEGR